MEPTFKLEMYAPKKQNELPGGPYGIYNQYIPVVPMGSSKVSGESLQYLNAPTNAISYVPNVKIPVQQVYNIQMQGPVGGHVEMNRVYEDLLPGKEHKLSSTTLGERIQTYDYVRQILLKIGDGEDISIENNRDNNLLGYIKLVGLNPDHYSPIYYNPYRGLPYGLLIYKACFPIRLDQPSQTIICAKNSIGLNIRLYALSYAEYYSRIEFQQTYYVEYDVWRELRFYEYIKENILKTRQSPNFVMLYAYFMSSNRKIDFFLLKSKCLTQKDLLTKEFEKFKKIHDTFDDLQPDNKPIRDLTTRDLAKKLINKLPDEKDPMLQKYSGTTMILVTEAPNHNLYQWASRVYQKTGIVSKMISHGFHSEKVWRSVLFQIVAGLYVLQYHGIFIRDMTIEDNIYIKDLQTTGKTMGYWIYIIDGISYYVPNYGYVVLIDTNYKDIYPQQQCADTCTREYKIYYADAFGKKYRLNEIRNHVFENYQRIINTNAFTKEHTQNNVTKPPTSIMYLLQNMMKESETNLSRVIAKHFRNLMNNRMGTFLKKDIELPNIRDINRNFKRGEMVIEIIENDLYKWAIFYDYTGNNTAEIITRNSPSDTDFITKKVRIETLKQYSISEQIEQNITVDTTFSSDDLLETYIISGY